MATTLVGATVRLDAVGIVIFNGSHPSHRNDSHQTMSSALNTGPSVHTR